MDIKIKHRIVGVVILLGLALIFIPLLFTHSSNQNASISSKIPSPPSKPPVQISNNVATPSTNSMQVATAINPAPQAVSNSTTTELAINPEAANPPSDDSMPQAASVTTVTLASSTAVPVTTPAAEPASTNPAASANPVVSPGPAAPPQEASPQSNRDENNLENRPSVVKKPQKKTRFFKAKYAQNKPAHHLEKNAVKSVGNVWVVQLASFNNKTNAKHLVKQLQGKGFAAYIHEAKANHKYVARVLVGPETRHEKANQLLQRLHHEFSLKGVVVKYQA